MDDITANSVKDTVRDFDDMTDAFPQRGQVSLVSQADLITLHQPHICDWYKDTSQKPFYAKNWPTNKLRRMGVHKPHDDTVPCTHKMAQNPTTKTEARTKPSTHATKRCRVMGSCVQFWGLKGDGEGLYLHHRTTGRKSSSENYHLNPSWAVWNRQSAFYSVPGPTWLLYCLESEKEN